MRNQKRLSALLLCAAFLLVLFVSSALIVHEADHDCAGEDCPICMAIALNAELLRLMGCMLAVFLTALLWTGKSAVRRCLERAGRAASGTLISWKIRLND